jgi:hypothetical protein
MARGLFSAGHFYLSLLHEKLLTFYLSGGIAAPLNRDLVLDQYEFDLRYLALNLERKVKTMLPAGKSSQPIMSYPRTVWRGAPTCLVIGLPGTIGMG